jgi:hypothetical protein
VPPHDATTPASFADRLTSISRRLRLVELLRISTVAAPMAAVIDLVLQRRGLSLSLASAIAVGFGVAMVAGWMVRASGRWTPAAAAKAFESTRPESRNLVVTAEELSRHPERARSWIRVRVLEQAASIIAGVAPSAVVPMSRPVVFSVVSALAAVLLVSGLAGRAMASVQQRAQDAVSFRSITPKASGLSLRATITPPPYTGEAAKTIENPDRIDAVQGSQLRLTVEGTDAWRVRFGSDPVAVERATDRSVIDLPLTRSGYLAIEPAQADTSQARRRLVPVTVTPDRAPTIRIEAPGKDLLLPDAKPTIAVAASATDDFGLRSLELRYTRASGTGENFEFQEGTIPLQIAHENPRAWTARAALALTQLGMAPGDAIIYRVVGRDARPGDAGLAVSDTFFVEIAGPGQVALEGFEMPPDRERYALSQQMIVLKLERLRAKEKSITRAALEEEIAGIAAEQRAVRANFIFLMGGHVEDEEEEAEHSDEIAEGRLENTARKEIVVAIQHMSRAEVGLAAVSTSAALPPAKAAVDALQRAFGRNRYFLRTLPVRSRVDPSRRLTGETKDAADWKREIPPPTPDPQALAARRLLERLIALSPALRANTVDPQALTAMAEEALAIDPAASEWQAVSKGLIQIRDSTSATTDERSKLFAQAVAVVSMLAQRNTLTSRPSDRANEALRGAWAEERR